MHMIPRFELVRHLFALAIIASGDEDIETAAASRAIKSKAWWEIVGILFVTVTLVGGSMYVMLSSTFDDGAKKWASGLLGATGGFWLK
jgi:hypothetical protein